VTRWITNPQAAAADCADAIASAADLLWVPPAAGRGCPVTAAEVGNAIATGLYQLAGCPGGVDFAGQHWCTRPHGNCPGTRPAGSALPAASGPALGAVHTPPWLAAAVTSHALDALVYRPGPLQPGGPARWQLVPSAEILALKVADIACGSGAFLLAACRHLADALCRAWQAEGDPRAGDTIAARRLIASRCLYGADINPAATALARLALQLLCYQPGAPVLTLDGLLIIGDSLLGIDWPAAVPGLTARGGFDAVIGNPPFLGGHKITGQLGSAYRDRLVARIARGQKGSADLSAYFLLRGWDLIAPHGQLAILATNTLAQGATRRVGLDQVDGEGGTIMWAIKSAPWPDTRVALEYCAVSISKAPVADAAPRFLASGTATAA
jgi:methylase of polypeptide subunit release factors